MLALVGPIESLTKVHRVIIDSKSHLRQMSGNILAGGGLVMSTVVPIVLAGHRDMIASFIHAAGCWSPRARWLNSMSGLMNPNMYSWVYFLMHTQAYSVFERAPFAF